MNYWGRYWAQPERSRIQGRLRALRPPNDGRWERVERWEYEPAFTPDATARTGITWPHHVLPETAQEAAEYDNDGGGQGIFGELIHEGDCMMRKWVTVEELEEYVRTWSAVHDWCEEHKDRVRLQEGGRGDSVDQCFAEMRDAEGWIDRARRMGVKGEEGWKGLMVQVEWGHGMLFCKRTEKK